MLIDYLICRTYAIHAMARGPKSVKVNIMPRVCGYAFSCPCFGVFWIVYWMKIGAYSRYFFL